MDEFDKFKKEYWVNHDEEQKARHLMGVILVILLACALGVAIALPMLYTLVCQLRGC